MQNQACFTIFMHPFPCTMFLHRNKLLLFHAKYLPIDSQLNFKCMFWVIGTRVVLIQLLEDVFDGFKFSTDQFKFISKHGLSLQLKVKNVNQCVTVCWSCSLTVLVLSLNYFTCRCLASSSCFSLASKSASRYFSSAIFSLLSRSSRKFESKQNWRLNINTFGPSNLECQ